ncbi:hypothetical protein TNCT_475841 [Trichonephila clavata]|uniref:Uncharacterized protein n=1 Tax=Trichonephila clavata TaxID=2740835 RepID=A0A8X6L510_TRICU|nr:hypothetical protein TNCT_475841 [Trichonephila clavata]
MPTENSKQLDKRPISVRIYECNRTMCTRLLSLEVVATMKIIISKQSSRKTQERRPIYQTSNCLCVINAYAKGKPFDIESRTLELDRKSMK